MALLQSVNLTARVLCSGIEVPLLGEMFNEWCGRVWWDVLLFSFVLFETLLLFLRFGLLHLPILSSPVVRVKFIQVSCDFQLCAFVLLIMAQDSTMMRHYLPQKDWYYSCKGWYISPEDVLSLPEVVLWSSPQTESSSTLHRVFKPSQQQCWVSQKYGLVSQINPKSFSHLKMELASTDEMFNHPRRSVLTSQKYCCARLGGVFNHPRKSLQTP